MYILNKKANSSVIIFVLIIIGLLLWGVVGELATQDPGVTCDMGIGNVLCWRWHTNIVGQIDEFFRNLKS